jgi:TRAP-type C4-dicarboxylate transport system permease small subunit
VSALTGSEPRPAAPARREALLLRLIDGSSTLCGFVSAFMIVAAVGVTLQLIFVRFVLNQSTIWQTEAVIYLMVGATLVGLPYVQRLRGHVNVDLVPLMLPPPVRRVLAAAVLMLTMAVIGLMAFYGFEMFEVAWRRGWRSDTVWGAPLWIPYLALPVGFGLFLLQLAADLWRAAFEGDPSAVTAPEPGLGR